MKRNHLREIILYLIFGVLTTGVSILSFALFQTMLSVHELIANIFSWILAVLFAYVTNRIWVFKSTSDAFLKEMVTFFCSRLSTLFVEEFLLFVGISLFHYNSLLIKTIAQVIIIILNYLLSKLFVFAKRED